MEFRQLRYFVAVAEIGNIGLAAQRLNLSQPPVTRQIQALELELGVQLLIRTPRGVELTEAGRVFQAEAERILHQTDFARDRTRQAHQGMIGTFEVAFFGSTIYRAVPFALRRFRAANPGVAVRLTRLAKQDQIERIMDKRIHVGFGRYYPPAAGIKNVVIGQEKLFAAVSNDAAICTRSEVNMADLALMPMVLFPAGDRPSFADEIIGAFRSLDITISIDSFVDDCASALGQVACGVGCCIVPESVAMLQFPTLNFIPIRDCTITVPISCIYLEESDMPTMPLFLDYLLALQGQADWLRAR